MPAPRPMGALRLLLCVPLVACAAGAPPPERGRGAVITEISQAMRFCVDSGGFRDGASVHFLRAACSEQSKAQSRECHDEEIAAGRVVQILDERCALLSLPADARIRPGDSLATR